MRLGIVADTHDQFERTRVAIKMLSDGGAEVLFHCGDLTSPPILELCSVLPCYFTFGNNDVDEVELLRDEAGSLGVTCLGWGDVVEVDGKRIGLVHGHQTSDLKRVMNGKPDYLLSGHSHVVSDTRVGSVRRINPGALHRASRYSVAILDLQSDDLQMLNVPR